jgi:16S rRNA (adenine1518-N6/adenine1519-N6)-dimethyltransferase
MSLDGLPPLSQIIRDHGLNAKKSLSQNFILDLNLTGRIARSADPFTGRTVIEIGPGPGGLTRALLSNGAERLIVIERDERCLPALEQIAAHYPGRMEIRMEDAMQLDPAGLPAGPKVIVGNLPYGIATTLLVGWLTVDAWPPWWESMTLMFQREVAERIVAEPRSKAYGRLSVLSQWLTRPKIAFNLPPEAFTPQPKVSSSVVRFEPIAAPTPQCRRQTLEDAAGEPEADFGGAGETAARGRDQSGRAGGGVERGGVCAAGDGDGRPSCSCASWRERVWRVSNKYDIGGSNVAVLQTMRLTLSPCRPTDCADFMDLERDPEVMRFLNGGRPVDREQSDPNATFLMPDGTEAHVWTARRTTTGAFVGWFCLWPDSEAVAELGYRLRRMEWGQGLASEGASALVDWGFTSCGYDKFTASTMAVNHASRRVMEKIGLNHARTVRFDGPEVIPGSEEGEVVYELTRAGWKGS